MQKINIYTENYFVSSQFKYWIKKILGKNSRGPLAVMRSLVSGLDELNVSYSINSKIHSRIHTACILSNHKTLAWALKQKKLGHIKKIIAGPNIAITPNDFGKMLQHPDIDIIIVPSQWVKDFYTSVAPQIASKIRIWAAGVALSENIGTLKDTDFLVYAKTCPDALIKHITDDLGREKYSYQLIKYGKFSQQEYFNLLSRSKYLIYLTESESQGIAMFEAWVRNVPTLVWDRGFWAKDQYKFEGNTASPYLNNELGMRFKNVSDFKNVLETFVQESFSPDKYVKNNFTFKISAEKYLNIVSSLENE